jgi:hypothetical protein
MPQFPGTGLVCLCEGRIYLEEEVMRYSGNGDRDSLEMEVMPKLGLQDNQVGKAGWEGNSAEDRATEWGWARKAESLSRIGGWGKEEGCKMSLDQEAEPGCVQAHVCVGAVCVGVNVCAHVCMYVHVCGISVHRHSCV